MDVTYSYETVTEFTDTELQIFLGFFIGMMIFTGIVVLFNIIINFRLFQKAGRPGWYAFIPIFDQLQLYKMVWGSYIPFILLFLPFVGTVVGLMHLYKLPKAFGESTLFCVLSIFVPMVCWAIIAFGDAKYIGPDGLPEKIGEWDRYDHPYHHDNPYQNNYNPNYQGNFNPDYQEYQNYQNPWTEDINRD